MVAYGLEPGEWEHLAGEDDVVVGLAVALRPMASDLEQWQLLAESSSLDCKDTVGVVPGCGT